MKSIYYEKNIPKVLLTKFNAKHCKALLFSGLNAVNYDHHLPDPFIKNLHGLCRRGMRQNGAERHFSAFQPRLVV